MAKITRIEDVTNIVGIKNYVAALSLDKNKLIYKCFEKRARGVAFLFEYDENNIQVSIDKKKNIYNMDCSCGEEYCPHVALSVMHLLTNEQLIEDSLSEVNGDYDVEFNEHLFEILSSNYRKKERISLDVTLKSLNRNFEYELKIKIGIDKKYVLIKKLDEFLEVYHNQQGTVEFGANFIYNPVIQEFDPIDQKIIEFLELYYDSQSSTFKSYYGYYTPRMNINLIKLSGKSLLNFLELLKNKKFFVEEGYYTYGYNSIKDDYTLQTTITKSNENIKVIIPYELIIPFTENYEYIIVNNEIYHCKNSKLLKVLVESQKKQLIFKEEEFASFASFILPALEKLDRNITIDSNLKDVLKKVEIKPRFYFDYEKDKIECKIKMVYEDIEKNIMDLSNKFGNNYVIRNYEKENQYILELEEYGFKINEEKENLYLDEEDLIVSFMNEHINYLVNKYDIYMTKRLKEFKVFDNTSIQSQFKIGRDNILSFSFEIDNIDKKEISSLLDSIQLKKKYYKLKNGNWIRIDNNPELLGMSKIVEQLDISNKELKNDNIEISKYKSLVIDQIDEEYEFIKIDNTLMELINKFKSYKELEINFSKDEKILLRDYQQVGIKWMLTLASCNFGGILADEMGLGKSIQTIKYIEKRKEENNNRKFIIVVPTSLIYNWENEFKKFSPQLKFVVVNESKEKREKIINDNDYDIYITTYGLIRQDIELYQKFEFDTCIIDEAQNIKNVNAETTKAIKNIKAINHFALTGTPIENSILELWSIFDFLMPGFMPNLTKFKHIYTVKNIEEDNSLLHDLNRKVAPFILRRKKKDVLTELPDKIMNNVLVELNEEQKKLYVSYLEKTRQDIDDTIKKEGFMKSQVLILSLLTKLRQICIAPKLIVDNYNGISSKIEALVDMIEQTIKNGHKILLFSQFPSALKIVKKELENKKIDSYYLDGSTKSKDRIKLVTEFNQNEIPIFLISLKAGGTGLNLTSADVVIHLDPWWNPQVENQATDRSHRIGQKNVVEVVKLIAKGTIEEKIIELQEKKQKLSDQVIEGEDRDQIILSKLTEQEIRDILNN